MPDFTTSATVKAPIATVWDSWNGFGDIYEFHPGVEKSYIIDDTNPTGLGAHRRCDFVGGKNYILEEIVAYKPERQLKLKIYDGNVPIKYAFVTFNFSPMPNDQTKITVEVEFVMKFGPFGRLLRPIMRKQLRKGIDDLLKGNASHNEAKRAA